jgi:hypothetical protein
MAVVLANGDKVLVVQRRLFQEDEPRYFVGTVEAYDAGVALVTGRTWARDRVSAAIVEKDDVRTKIIPLGSGTFLAYRLPASTDLEALRFDHDRMTTGLAVTDGRDLTMDLTEHVLG